LKGILNNSSLTNRFELIAALDQMSQPDPQAQQMQQVQQQLALQAAQAQIAVDTTKAEQNRAEAQKLSVETQLMPQEVQAKVLASATKNLPSGGESDEFDKRVKIAELMLKEADIKNKSKIVELQMNSAKNNVVDVENDFLETLNTELTNGNR
jgi:xanthine dehydrogenase iron-sulfur cluster and FAD-binding subunit A